MIRDLNETIVAPATSLGQGAIAIVRMSGDKAITIAKSIFKGKDLTNADPGQAYFGRILDDDDKILDEVLLTIFRNPRSYTGEDLVEISCHASSFIVNKLISLIVQGGARLADKGEFTMRAYLNGKMDLSQAEAVADLIASESGMGHELAMNQMRGNISNKIEDLRQQLIDFASLLELELDFSEEDVEFADRTQFNTLLDEVQIVVQGLIESFKLGNVIKKGVPTVIAGRPNAGKSTLLNALLQEDRAIVSEIAGTTRDTIEELININGIQFRFIDTAGLRETKDVIEASGVQRTLDRISEASLVVYLFDLNAIILSEILEDLQNLPLKESGLMLVANKVDTQADQEKLVQLQLDLTEYPIIGISAKFEKNIEYLKERLYQEVLGEADLSERIIVSNSRHLEALQHVRENLIAVKEGFANQIPSDLIAMDMRQALHYLGTITGAIGTDDLLGNIFGKFCIGK
jgi:tRNA modification GTPase